MAEITVREVTCRSALGTCGLPGFRYSVNPYRGCQHGCVYCYSPAVLREQRAWGSFVDVRVDMPTVLARELARKERGPVWLGSVTDAYQPVEARYSVTRKCLEQLARADAPVSLLTKSGLVARDYDLMKRFSEFELGFSITCADEGIRTIMEPGASPLDDRLRAMAEASKAGLRPWAFIAPIMPGITTRPREIEMLIEKLAAAGIKKVGFDPFRPKPGIWARLRPFLSARLPESQQAYSTPDPQLFTQTAARIERECSRRGIAVVG
jgi:DNA repair photolyase